MRGRHAAANDDRRRTTDDRERHFGASRHPKTVIGRRLEFAGDHDGGVRQAIEGGALFEAEITLCDGLQEFDGVRFEGALFLGGVLDVFRDQ